MPDLSIVDVDECDTFYYDLTKFNDDLENLYYAMWDRLVALGDNWRDPQYDRLYETLYEELRPGIERYRAIADDIAGRLRKQVDLAIELTGRR